MAFDGYWWVLTDARRDARVWITSVMPKSEFLPLEEIAETCSQDVTQTLVPIKAQKNPHWGRLLT